MAETHLLVTGPAAGLVRLADGTLVDVTPDVIEFDSPEAAAEAAHHIGLQHEQRGTFGPDWTHADCTHCEGTV